MAASSKTAICFRVAVLLTLALAITGQIRAERLPLKTFTIDDGLARDQINRIVRDSRGFLWFCTSQGLLRFDGYKFTSYTTEDGLPDRNVTDLLETSEGVYWVTTTGGLCRFNPTPSSLSKFAVQALSDDQRSRYTHNLIEDRSGTVWCGTGGGLYRAKSLDGQWAFGFVEIGLPESRYGDITITALLEGRRGELWIGAESGLYRRLADGRVERYTTREGLPGDAVQALVEDKAGQLWVGTTAGLCKIVFEPASNRPVVNDVYTVSDGLSDNKVASLFQAYDGRLWIGMYGGLSVLAPASDKSKQRLRTYTEDHGLSSKDILALADDRDGNLWIGTDSGAMKMARNGLVTFDKRDGFKDTRIGAVVEDVSGRVCAIDSKGFINQFDGQRFIADLPNLPKGINYPGLGWHQIGFQDRGGKWWVPTLNGLCRFPVMRQGARLSGVRPEAIFTTRDGMNGNEVFRLFEDSRGDIWIGTMDTARTVLAKWERATETFHRYSPEDGIPLAGPTAFGEDASGNIWIGFFTGGLLRHSAGRFTAVTDANGLPAGMVRGIYTDRKDRLWVATGTGGLARLDDPRAENPRFVTYTTAQGLSSNQANSITEDRWGRIYIATARGVDRLDPDTNRITHYTIADGLGDSFVYVAFRDRAGALWFGTDQGLSRFTPEAGPDRPLAPSPVFISGLRISGFAHPLSDLGETEIPGMELNANQNQIEIDFFGLSFSPGEPLRYQYKLEGSDQDWKSLTAARTVNYASLSPGDYRFIVRAVSADGSLSESPAGVSFTILSPVWRRWWFLTIAALLIAGAILSFDRYRAARVRAIKESEDRFRTLAETASDAIITIDAESRIIFVNPAAETVFGYTKQEMIGADLTILMPEYLRHLHKAGFARYAETGKRHLSWEAIELPGLHKSGREIPLEISFGEFIRNDKHFYTGVARDITERKRAEEALIKSKEERLVELERVRKRIATDLHDDIGSSLTRISLLSEVVRQQVGHAGTPFAEPLSMIAGLSRELVDSMSDIVWAINPKKDRLGDLSQRMRHFASDVLTARRVEFVFRAPDSERDVQVGANARREIFLIFKEAVNNMVRHSGCAKADIEFRLADDWLVLIVSDDGHGFDVLRESDGHGLLSMRERTNGLGGALEVVSERGVGTKLTLTVPLGQAVEVEKAKSSGL